MEKKLVIIAILFLLAMPLTLAVDRVIINSEDWRDVYSGLIYSNLNGYTKNFLVSDRHSQILLESLEKSLKDIQLISSPTVPFVVGYAGALQNAGFNVEELKPAGINLELAKRTTTNRFIVIDDSYGYNAVAVAPYAGLVKAYVLFADKKNIDDVVAFLQTKTLSELVIYGHVDREVKAALTQFNPVVINKEDRFDNNIEIVKRYQEAYKAAKGDINKQIILSDGEFLEEEIISGSEPVLFLGRQAVPDQIRSYISQSGVEVAVLIGNQYVGAATDIRRQLGISVFVKFARGARVPSSSISPVEGLDMFYVPTYRTVIELAGLRYNSATNMLEVTLRNTGEVSAYFKGSYSIFSELGTQGTVGDLDPVFIESGSTRTMAYNTALQGQNLSADAFVLYGESARSLENQIRQRYKIDLVRILDNSQIDIIGAYYDFKKGLFYIVVKNIGDTDVFVHVELSNVVIDGERYSFGSQGVVKISPGRSADLLVRPIPLMVESDLIDNPKVTVIANYGEREETLVKTLRKDLELRIKTTNYVIYGLAVVVILMLLLLLFVLRRRKCPDCGHRNARRHKACQKCGRNI